MLYENDTFKSKSILSFSFQKLALISKQKPNMFSANTYIERRKKLKEQVGSGVILLLGNEDSSMNYKDNIYPFRQDSSFFISLD